MKELYVSASLYYGYTIEVPDDFDENNESKIMELACDADPLRFNLPDVDNPETYFNSVVDEQGNILYDWG